MRSTAKMGAELFFVDTNVLLASSDPSRKAHPAALAVFNDWPGRGIILHASGQILREYLVVATRPRAANGLALSQIDAVANVAAFRTRLRFLAEDSGVADRLRQLLLTTACLGKQIHDANVVAAMLVHGVGNLVTSNVEDFQRFSDKIAIHPLPGAGTS